MTLFPARFAACFLCLTVLFAVGCSAQQTEQQALESLRQITSAGKTPSEAMVAQIEKRFAGKRTGALAKLLHAKIRFDAGDFDGAARLLDSGEFGRLTKVGGYALLLRGNALAAANRPADAAKVYEQLFREYPTSIRVREAKIAWAKAATATGRAVEAPPMLVELIEKNDGDALLAAAKAFEAQNSTSEARKYYRRTYFFAAGTDAAKAAAEALTAAGESLDPQDGEEQFARADRLLKGNQFADAANEFKTLEAKFPTALTPSVRLRSLVAYASAGRTADARAAFAAIPANAPEREAAYRELALGYAKTRSWADARQLLDEMRAKFPNGKLVPKTFVDLGAAAEKVKDRTQASYFYSTAVAAFPTSIEVADAQFGAAWDKHESGSFAISSRMLIEHLARYADKDTDNRGQAGYWSARDSERAGNTADACVLYDATAYRYGANWYGYLALDRLTSMKGRGLCKGNENVSEEVRTAAANLRKVTVARETAGAKELERTEKSDELSIVGLFDWAIDELNEARKTAPTSPKVNLALARHYRLKGDNVQALIAMQKSYPDYAQMFPEEMDREAWSCFYPLTNWDDITRWASARGLDKYQVAGFIRQETVFEPRARSGANAYGLMQLLLPTAKGVARRNNSSQMPNSAEDLYQPALNIELGTAFLKELFGKFGRVEYVAVAYNAGPGRVPQWRATLPPEIDDFVEEIPFKETKKYVQGIIRNTAQYRRLYDDNGQFKANVGKRPIRGEIDSKPEEQFTAEFPEITVVTPSGE
ncbi:MAG: lytic transglycosylase domain-containing protein [Pyrinomonadaceae bacterium]